MGEYLYSEEYIFSKFFSRNNISIDIAEKILEINKKIKQYLPQEFRELYHFYYFEDKNKYVLNIMNYRIFKLNYKKGEFYYQLSFPTETIPYLDSNYEIIDIWEFKAASVCALTFKYDEIINYDKMNYLSEAVRQLVNAKGSRERKFNVKVDLDDERVIKEHYEQNLQVENTEKEQIIKSRIGQGYFKKRLKQKECKCKICGIDHEAFLIASHIKPWIYSNNLERLDINNGFLLCPQHDPLFDKGFITFDDNGNIIISKLINEKTMRLMNIEESIKITINENNKKYLEWHRGNIFKG